ASLGGCFGALVGEPELLAVGLLVLDAGDLERGLVARAVAVDDELLADLERILRDAVANQAVRRSALDAPLLYGTVGAFHVDPDPRVRVDQFDFRNRAPQHERLVFAEHGIPRMMGAGRRGADGKQD